MTAIVRWCLQHKRIVAGFWLVLILVGMGTAGKASKALNSQYSNPGHESYTTNLAISREFGNGGSGAPLLAVVTLPARASSTPFLTCGSRRLPRPAVTGPSSPAMAVRPS